LAGYRFEFYSAIRFSASIRFNDDRFRDSPGCLETPKSAHLHENVENLAILRLLVE
jgi:hypothetical protein